MSNKGRYPCLFSVKAIICDKKEIEHGFIYADSFADAAEQLEKYYRDDLISIENLELFSEGIFLIPNENYTEIRNILEAMI